MQEVAELQDAQQVAKAYIERLKTGDVEEKYPTGFPLLDEAFNGGYRKDLCDEKSRRCIRA